MTSTELIAQADRRYVELLRGEKGFQAMSWTNGYIQGWMESQGEAQAEVQQLQDHVRGESSKRIEQQRRADALQAENKRLREVLSRLADAADVYSADQSYARDRRCGLVQPISVEEGKELNEAVAQAYAALSPAEGKEDK